MKRAGGGVNYAIELTAHIVKISLVKQISLIFSLFLLFFGMGVGVGGGGWGVGEVTSSLQRGVREE